MKYPSTRGRRGGKKNRTNSSKWCYCHRNSLLSQHLVHLSQHSHGCKCTCSIQNIYVYIC
ncbi:hypothetical protein HanIR_Chr02g0070081 [Helianthus annuus]|nr:hypothetical protein HanIR_Chr02g0070081 [Helianthus annuus]